MIHIPIMKPVIDQGARANIVSLWEFNETSGTTAADAVGSNPGTLVGVPTVNTPSSMPNITPCYDFDSSNNDYVSIPDADNLSFTNGSNDLPFSVNLWVNPESLDGEGANFINKRNTIDHEWTFLTFTNIILFTLYSEGATTNRLKATIPSSFATGNWYMVTATYDGSGSETGLKISKMLSYNPRLTVRQVLM